VESFRYYDERTLHDNKKIPRVIWPGC